MEVDDDEPDAKLVVAKQRFAQFEGPTGLYRHDTARVLCNNRQRQYRPIEIRQANREDFENEDDNSTNHHVTPIFDRRVGSGDDIGRPQGACQ
jgi:hypothetical protein